MIKKRETCLYCGEKMESITAKKKFCSTLHRVYYFREKNMVTAQEQPAFFDSPKAGNSDEPPKLQTSNPGDPKEGSVAFFLKYESLTYAELAQKLLLEKENK